MWPVRFSLILLSWVFLTQATSIRAFETVVIDPGHGGNDQGSQWYHVMEKDLTLAVAERVEYILRSFGLKTVMTRRYDHYVGLDQRAIIGNHIPNSLFLSIHFNASSSQSITGAESFYQGESSKLIASSIQHSLDGRPSSRGRGVTKQNYAVLMRSLGCAVLIECGFMSNKAECMKCNTSAWQWELAEAIAMGVIRAKPIVNYDFPAWEIADDGTPAPKPHPVKKSVSEAKKKVAASNRRKGKKT